ncbi:MAG TPA: twin-arginine translocation signal domain-containing protein [Geminicoccus sp.]|jgi:predicted esterase|uniref:alpha/beta hydrolase n=1 Tax=Geminicoccus sp. TaxID=2024832 RepID=UPI002E3032D2|nr:twin-arginine translocation signal domain-containing protein [Geminicoccus sp.]HEX2527412.1 twin-arginine translocation signal domain-containing protein [Geminicoccus sp.]
MARHFTSRRRFLQAASALVAAVPFLALGSPMAAEARLTARPGRPSLEPMEPGLHPLGLDGARDGRLYVPQRLDLAQPVPLVVMLHGAGGTADQVVPILRAAADRTGSLLLAPDSRSRRSWDVIQGGYGPDITYIDRALGDLFTRFPIDARHIAMAGFSDGASYALSVGLTNGDLVSDILAFSPGFAAPVAMTGRPQVFISHGVVDEILPIDRCGRRLARDLARTGYDVDYREFAGGHVVPPDLADAAMDRFTAGL